MSKEYVEALQFIVNEALFSEFAKETNIMVRKCNDIVRQALKRLEAIDNASPSEALESLEKMIRDFNETTTGMNGLGEIVVGNELLYFHKKELDTIEQALLKAQEQEKVLNIIIEKNVDVLTLNSWFSKGIGDLKTYNYDLEDEDKLTQEEFDLLKKYFNENKEGKEVR